METLKQANYALKIESIKNRIVCNDLDNDHTSVNPQIMKNKKNIANLYINNP